MKRIIIEFDDEHAPEETIRYVANSVEQGYYRGFYPDWFIEETEEDDDEEEEQEYYRGFYPNWLIDMKKKKSQLPDK